MHNSVKSSGAHAAADEVCQSLSCLIDGELERDSCAAVVARLAGDAQARQQWMLMNAAGDALRSSEVAALHSERFVARVAQALQREPTVLSAAASRQRTMRRVLVPGAAVAAAAAMLAVIAVPQLRGDSTGLQASSKAAGETKNVAAAAPAAHPAEIARVSELERYLMAHRELAGGSVMPRSASYLRTSTTLPREAR